MGDTTIKPRQRSTVNRNDLFHAAQRRSPPRERDGLQGNGWRRPTLPRSLNRSTIGAARLNDRVRNGNGCGPRALVDSQNAGSLGVREPGSQVFPWLPGSLTPSKALRSDDAARNAEEIKLHGRLVALG